MVDTAIRVTSDPTMWLCIAITTPWPGGDNNPPNEADFVNNPQYINMTSISQAIAFKRVDESGLVVPDALGDIMYQNQNYISVPNNQGVAQMARWAHWRATINYSETNSKGTVIIGNVTYRQYVLCSGLQAMTGWENEDVLAPNQVKSVGQIVMVTNFIPHTHNTTVREIIDFVKEIRG